MAYSYIRFSSPEQAKGDSMRRQLERTRAFCQKENAENENGEKLILDETMRDPGVSAYRGKHRKEGALGGFLRAVQSGQIATGSLLVIESLDRLSREQVRFAQAELLQLINHGIEIVTLADKQRYSAKTVDQNPGLLFGALAVAMRAHDESAMKADRIASRWVEKRRRIAAGEHVRQVLPAWLRWEDRKVVAIPERAKLIVEVFEKTVEGIGRRRIAASFNERSIQPWGRGKRKARGGWQESYISKLLGTREVTGEFQAHRMTAGRNSKREPMGDPVLGYYPCVVSKELWHAAQKPVTQAPARGRQGVTPFTGLVFDELGAAMHVERKGEGCNYWATSRAYRRPDRRTFKWRMAHFEATVRPILLGLDWRKVLARPEAMGRLRQLRGEVAETTRQVSTLQERFKKAADLALDAETKGLDALGDAFASKIKTLTEDLRAAEEKKRQLEIQLAEQEAGLEVAEANGKTLKELLESRDPLVAKRLRRELSSVVSRFVLYPEGDVPDGLPVEELRDLAAGMLVGTQGLEARARGQVCGAVKIEFRNRQALTVWVTYRPADRRTANSPSLLALHGLGFEKKADWVNASKQFGIPLAAAQV